MKHTLKSISAIAATLMTTGSLITEVNAALVDTFQFGGHTYQIYDDALTWSAARDFSAAQTFGGQFGYLTRIDSMQENDAIYSTLVANDASFSAEAFDGGGARYAWIGASDLLNEGDWLWENGGDQFWQGDASGTQIGGLYNNWGDEPDDFGGAQDAAAIALDDWPVGFGFLLGVASQWNDIDDTNNLPFIVEFDVIPEPSSALLLGLGTLGMATCRRRIGRIEQAGESTTCRR